jgi:hypothetical protein
MIALKQAPVCTRREFSEPEKKRQRWKGWREERDEQRKADAIKILKEVGETQHD